MKKILFTLCTLTSLIGFSQITDENDHQAADASGNTLTGNIGIGTTNSSASLEIRRSNGSIHPFKISDDAVNYDIFRVENDNDITVGRNLNVAGFSFLISNSMTLRGTNVVRRSGASQYYSAAGTTITNYAGGGENISLRNSKLAFGAGESAEANSKIEIVNTNSNLDHLRISSSEATSGDIFTVKSDGNVGIGTTNPATKLDVEGGDLYVGNEVSQNGQRRQIRVYGYDSHQQFYGSMHSNYDNNTRTFDISTSEYTNQIKIDASTNNNANIAILPGRDGSVGIGTDTPNAKLDIHGDFTQTGLVPFKITRPGTSGYFKIVNATGQSNKLLPSVWGKSDFFMGLSFVGEPSEDNADDVGISFDSRIDNNAMTNGAIAQFSTMGDVKVKFMANGKVGIGTTTLDQNNDDSLLLVNGKILCKEVEVIADLVPDYVFEKYYTGTSTLKADYKMPTLEEVEAYTKENHHLPEVPSAAEIKEEGMQLKAMTTILLQKIEELTLYTIEQEKRIKTLEAKLTEKE